MKKQIFKNLRLSSTKLLFCFISSFFFFNKVKCQTTSCGINSLQITITANSNLYQSCKIDNNPNSYPDSSKNELAMFAWTANSINVPLYNGRSFIKYNLSKLPSNAKINSAKLYLHAKTTGALNGVAGQPTYGTNNTVLIQKIVSNWVFPNVSLTNLPKVDTVSKIVLAQSTNTAEDYIVDMTYFIQSWVAKPDSNFGVMLRMQTENNPYNSMIFEAGQATDTNKNIRLEICYSLPIENTCPINSAQMVITADTTKSNLFQSCLIGNISNSSSNSNKSELAIFAWTANSIGVPLYNGRSFLKYSLTKIPANAKVNSAKLYLYAKTTGTTLGVAGQPIYGTKNTVLMQKVVSNWVFPYVSFTDLPMIDTASQIVLTQSTNTAQDYIVDMTKLIQSWVARPDSNYGVMLRMQTENNPYNSMIFEAGQATDPTKNARLEICYNTILPIELTSFTCTLNGVFADLNIETANELNASSIIIEKSLDGTSFTTLTTLSAKGSKTNSYAYSSLVAPFTSTVYYRLKLVNNDGSFMYSKTITLNANASVKNLSAEIYPNPISNAALKVSLYAVKEGGATINIIDNNGKVVITQKVQANKGINNYSISAFTTIRAGVYIVNIVSKDASVNKKVVKIK